MNAKIMKISSDFMYNGQLIADKSVSDGNLTGYLTDGKKGEGDFLSDLTVPLMMIDTAGGKIGDSQSENTSKLKLLSSMSRFNTGEGIIVKAVF